jgi:hypothetical protein
MTAVDDRHFNKRDSSPIGEWFDESALHAF